jgi:hypothetical protein
MLLLWHWPALVLLLVILMPWSLYLFLWCPLLFLRSPASIPLIAFICYLCSLVSYSCSVSYSYYELALFILYLWWPGSLHPVFLMTWLSSSCISDDLALFILYLWWSSSINPVSLMIWLCSSYISDDLALFILYLSGPSSVHPISLMT